jgi:hypothetical protein
MNSKSEWFARIMVILLILWAGAFIGILAERSFGPHVTYPNIVLEGHATWVPDEEGEPEFTWLPMCTEDHD